MQTFYLSYKVMQTLLMTAVLLSLIAVSYTHLIYSAVISAIVYPIEAGWVWNSAGWLAKLGYVDFAGSSVIHMVGGIASVIGAAMLGPRIGKYTKGKDGKVVVNAFP